MAKNTRTNKRKQAQAAKAEVAPAAPVMTRRNVLRWGRNGAIAAVVIGGAGYVGTGWYREYLAEHDLTRLGQGKPAVVQVHDPQCPICLALQHETRAAMKQFGECDFLYLVADIKQEKGAAFAARHNVPHVTLLLLDGEGAVKQVLRGPRQQAELATILATHFETYGTDVRRS